MSLSTMPAANPSGTGENSCEAGAFGAGGSSSNSPSGGGTYETSGSADSVGSAESPLPNPRISLRISPLLALCGRCNTSYLSPFLFDIFFPWS